VEKQENEDQVVYSFDDVSPVDETEVSSVVEEDSSPPSGPASAPSGTPPGFVVESPTWWKSSMRIREGITRPIKRFTKDLAVHHYFPGIHGEVCIVETPVKLLRSFWFVGGIVVGCNVFMSQGVGCVDALAWIKDKHLLEEIKGCHNNSSPTVQKCYEPYSPTGSLQVSFSLNGIRSLFGRLFTKRNVCRNGKLFCVEVVDERHIFACDGSDDIFGRCSQELGDNRELVNVYTTIEKGLDGLWNRHFTYDLYQGTMAFLPTSRQIYIPRSRYQLQHRIFARLT
jgi:hypothetical protein